MLARAYSYKPRKRTGEKPTIRYEAPCRKGRTFEDMVKYLEERKLTNIVEMHTAIGKLEDKKCILTIYFKESKLILMYLINKYKPALVNNVFDKLKKRFRVRKF